MNNEMSYSKLISMMDNPEGVKPSDQKCSEKEKFIEELLKKEKQKDKK